MGLKKDFGSRIPPLAFSHHLGADRDKPKPFREAMVAGRQRPKAEASALPSKQRPALAALEEAVLRGAIARLESTPSRLLQSRPHNNLPKGHTASCNDSNRMPSLAAVI